MIERIFNQLDDWRHLPGYQLERRADIFFGCYLKEILEAQDGVKGAGIALHKTIIPEFPLPIDVSKSLPSKRSKNLSNNVDYVAFSEDGVHAFLVELKTDEGSFSYNQLKYLANAKDTSFADILGNLIRVFNASKTAKRKHFKLLKSLEKVGLVKISDAMTKIFDDSEGDLKKLCRLSALDRDVIVLKDKTPRHIHIYYLKPKSTFNPKLKKEVHSLLKSYDVKTISFDDVQRVLEGKSEDLFARRFAQSLESWSTIKAGGKAMLKG